MKLRDLVPDPETAINLDPEDLGLLMIMTLKYFFSRTSNNDVGSYVIWALGGRQYEFQYPEADQESLKRAIREAWAWLETSVLIVPEDDMNRTPRKLSRRGERLASASDPRGEMKRNVLRKESLDGRIRDDVWTLFHRKKFDSAVFEAMKAVEVAVREASGLPETDIGINLMRKAFDPKTGALTDLASQMAEREARSSLFAGAIGSYKNPHSHRYVALSDPDETAEIIMLANHLLRIVDARRSASTSGMG
jgi:uncharacterized protein (TIGR02391 family)